MMEHLDMRFRIIRIARVARIVESRVARPLKLTHA